MFLLASIAYLRARLFALAELDVTMHVWEIL